MDYALFTSVIILLVNFHFGRCYLDEPAECEPIRVEMCSHLKYNMTRMPNFLGHQTQQEAREELKPYSHLVDVLNCSVHLKFLLCSLFVPMCTKQMDGPLVIEVCRSMCLQVKQDCEPVLSKLQVQWPLNCSRLPEESTKEQLCMAPDDVRVAEQDSSIWGEMKARENQPAQLPATPSTVEASGTKSYQPSVCPNKYIRYDNNSCTDLCDSKCKDCIPDCKKNVYFTEHHKNFAYAWIAIWSSLCILSTLFTVIAFCIDPERFRYPTRPIIFMAFCYLMYALAYFIRLFMSASDIICKPDGGGNLLMIVNGLESTLCVIIFLIQYYFGLASHIWWLVLTLTWYLAASRKWGLEAINSIACYFHLIAWAVPAVLTIAILVTGKVDSDELTGMCYVGNHDRWSLVAYVIVPVCTLLLTGEVFILAGFAALFRVRTNLKTTVDNTNFRKLEKLMAKIGVFAILYTVPAVSVLGSHIHECINMDTWRCLSAEYTSNDTKLTSSIPTVEIHMLKIFMSLIIGITISMWVLSAKTVKSCEKKCCAKRYSQATNLSYTVTAPADYGNCYVQHYKFPTRKNTVGKSHYNYDRHEAQLYDNHR